MKEKQTKIYLPDEESINFMEIKTGGIIGGILYRSSSPLKGGGMKNIKGMLAARAGINCIINLADDNSVIERLAEDVPWYQKLALEGKVTGLPMTFTIPGVKSNEKKLKTALRFMLAHEGPYLIHCFAGIDRTGFVSALLEALMGASLKEISNSYLLAIYPDYGSSFCPDFHSKMKKILGQLKKMAHGEKLTSVNIQQTAENYLLTDIGLSFDEIIQLKNILSGRQ
jgi:hypothetical protein